MKRYRFFLALLLGYNLTSGLTWAQNAPITANPNAQRDIQVVGDYVTAMTVTGDQEKARGLLTPTYVAYGPGSADSANIEKSMKNWQAVYKNQVNRKNDFSAVSFRVPSGTMKGDWVSLWGTFGYTDVRGGTPITFPYQYTAKVDNGKIVQDRIYFDELSVLKHFGFKVIPPGTPAK